MDEVQKMVLNATGTTPGINQQCDQGIWRVQKMKRPRKLSVAERQYLQSMKVVAENWLISKKMSDEWVLVHKLTDVTRNVPAP